MAHAKEWVNPHTGKTKFQPIAGKLYAWQLKKFEELYWAEEPSASYHIPALYRSEARAIRVARRYEKWAKLLVWEPAA